MKKTLCIICALAVAVIMVITAFADSVDICGVPQDSSHTATALTAKGSLGQTFIPKTAFNTITIYAPTWTKTDSGFTFQLYSGGPSGKVIFKQTVTNAVDGQTTFVVGDRMGGTTYYYEITKPVDQIGLWTRPTDVYSDGSAYVNGVAKNYDFEFDVVYDNGNTTAVGNELNSSSSTPSGSSAESSAPSGSSAESSAPSGSSAESSAPSGSSAESSAPSGSSAVSSAPSGSSAVSSVTSGSSAVSSASSGSSAVSSTPSGSSAVSSVSSGSSAVSSAVSDSSAVATDTASPSVSNAADDTAAAATSNPTAAGRNPNTGDVGAAGLAVLVLLSSAAIITVKLKNK